MRVNPRDFGLTSKLNNGDFELTEFETTERGLTVLLKSFHDHVV